MTKLVWCDGAIVPPDQATVSVVDRTVLYGLGAFETVRLHAGRPFRLDRHLQRLHHSLAAVDLTLPAVAAELVEGLPRLAERCGIGAGLARITVTAGVVGGPGGRVTALCDALPARPPGSVKVGVVPSPHAASPLLGVKSTSYLANYLLREQAQRAGRIDDLLMDGEGRITEATTSNVFVVREGVLATPPESAGLLPGITREAVLELAATQGLQCQERPIARSELARVDECFLTSSVKGVMAVQVLDGRSMPSDHPVADALAAGFVATAAAECGVDPSEVVF